jgi:TP901 family phage tail tape measure protein|nr:MAG TPA: minor tail protein [Caudoviricetes sp.]
MASNSDIIKIGFDYKDNLEKFLKDYDGTMDQVQKSADGKRIEIQFDVTDKNVMKKISSLQGEFKNVKIELDGKPLERQLDSIEDIKKVLTNVVDMVNKRMSFDSLFDTKSLTKELEIFSKIEDHLSSLRSVISDVGDGEELSPLLKTIEKVSEAVSNLNMKFNMNIDVGSDNEMERELQKKASNALLAYENLREHLFSTYRGDNYTSELLYKFDPSQFDTTIGKIEGYKKFIENLRASIKENYGHDKLYEDSDKSYWNKASAAYGQITKVRNAMKADSEGSPLDNLFGSKTDLTEVIEQLKLIVTELGNVSAAAAEIKTVLGNGIQINDSLQQIEALTQKVKELETELTSLKSGTSLPSTETNISSESSSMEQVQKSTDQAVQAKEDFAKTNASVQASVDESKSPLQLEAKLMEKIAESARKAADAKKEFVETNGKVAASAKESNVSLNSDLTSGHSEVSEPTGIKKYQKKGYKAHDTGNHDNEKKVVNKKELGNALKELQSEIIANIDSANSFIKDVTDFYDSNDNLVKTQMKVLDKNGNMSTYTTSYSMDKDGNATAWTSHIDSQKFEDKNQEYQNQLKTIRELSAEKQKLQEQDRKSEVNQALKDQLYAYKQIQSIREKIASTDDENLIAELEKQKQTYQEQYLAATKILKNNSDLYNSESRLNELLQIGLKTTQKISEAEIKRNSAADNKKVKEWDDVNAKNQADIWKENQKAIQNYVNAVKKLQDLLAEDKGTGSKAAAIEKQQGKIKQLEEEALNARAILSSMVNPHTSDASTWDAWVKTMDKLSDASHDAKAAVDDVKKSIQAALTSEYKSMNDGLADYEAKMRSFNSRKPEDRSSDYSTALKGYTDALERYRNELQKIQSHPELINETEINSLKNMRNELDKAATSLKGIEKGSTAISRDKMISKISDYMKKNSAMSKEFKSELEGLIQKLKTLGAEADTTRIADEFFKITQRIREAGQEGKKFWDVVKEKAWYGLAGTIGTYFGFNDLIQYGRQAAQTIINLDTALVDLKKTTTMSSSQLKEFYFDANNVAKQMGVSTQQIIEQASAWSRLGYNTQQTATEMAKLSSKFASISPGMDTTQAQEGLVSIMKAFDVDTNDVESKIMDKINTLGNKFAESNLDIVEGLKRSSAAMAAMGQSFEDTAALFTGGMEILQDSESMGTALRSVAMRIRGYSEETGELDGELQNVNGDVLALTKTAKDAQGVSIFTDATQQHYKSMVQYLGEIADRWDDISEQNQTELLNKLFAKTRAQAGAAILKNFDQVRKALAEMEQSAGSADREMETVESSLEYKLNSLKETWVGTAQAIIDRGDLGTVIDGITKISEVLGTLIDKIGLVKGAAIALGAALSFNNVGRGKMHPLIKIKFEYADSTYNLLWIQRFRTCQS